MRTINIFGRRMPIVAILMALLVIGTASAAVYQNYATLDGNVGIDADIVVIDSTGHSVPIGGDGDLVFDSPATFTIVNNGADPVNVALVGTVLEVIDPYSTSPHNEAIPDGEEGYYSIVFSIDGTIIEDPAFVLIPPSAPDEGSTMNVELVTAPNVEGVYNVEIIVNPVALS